MNIPNYSALLAGLLVLGGCATTPPSVDDIDRQAATEMLAVNMDSDNDTIPDANDSCADSNAGIMVDAEGCEIVMGPIAGLNFGPNVVSLPESARPIMDKYIDAMKRYPDVVVSVEGHTDNRGPAAGNLELSKERVLSVVRYMVVNGISPSRIKPYGYGESRPRAANATAEGREQNRRIEIKVLEGLR